MLTLNCTKCDEPMPPIDEDTEEGKELKRLLLTTGVSPTHEVCPRDRMNPAFTRPASAGRRFEARVQIVELVRAEHDLNMVHDFSDISRPGCPPNCPALGDARADELASFIVFVDEPNLPEAMRPLALKLGEEWMKVESVAEIADQGPGREGPMG